MPKGEGVFKQMTWIFNQLKRWRASRDGVTAIEFALLAGPFILLVMGIIELALMNTSAFILQGAVSDAARLIRTGQVQQSGADPEQMFADELCRAGLFLECDQIQYTVETLTAFADADAGQVDENGTLLNPQFDPGGSREVVLIRAVYLYPFLTPLIGEFFSDYPGNTRLLMSTIVLETEPYELEEE